MLLQIEEIKLTVAVGSLLIIFFCIVIVVTIMQYKQKVYKHMVEKEKLTVQFSETLLRSQLEIKEQMMQQLAFELHDNIGQVASLIKINLNTMILGYIPAERQRLEETLLLVKQMLIDLKSLSLSLSSDRIKELGLVNCLIEDVRRINSTGQFLATFSQEGDIPLRNFDTVIILYRMMQEIINNAIKHSKAEKIEIVVSHINSIFILICKDNGTGFDHHETVMNGGTGLMNLKNRARLIDAKVTVISAGGIGTTVRIELKI